MIAAPIAFDTRTVVASSATIASNSKTFTLGRLYLVFIGGSGATARTCTSVTKGGTVTGTLTETNGGTDSSWTDGVPWSTTCFTSTDLAGTGTLTGNFSAAWANGQFIDIYEISTGFDPTGTIVQSIVGNQAPTATTATATTLANSAAAANMRAGFFVHRLQEAFSANGGGALVPAGGNQVASPAQVRGLWHLQGNATQDPSVSWTTNTRGAGYVALEIKAAVVTPIASRWAISGLKFLRDSRRYLVKAVNVFAVVPYIGSGLDDQFTWFAVPANVRNFARHLKSHGFTAVRLPCTYDTSTAYADTIGAFGAALWEHGIATLVTPFDGNTFCPTGGDVFDAAAGTRCGQWLSDTWTYLSQPDWFLFDSYNEPNNNGAGPGTLTDAQWATGMKALIDAARSGGYSGPISIEAPGYGWSYPTTAGSKYTDLLTYDTFGTGAQIWAQVHRYVTQDLGSGPVAADGSDSRIWRAAWPDAAAADGVCIAVGEFGPALPGSGDYGSGSTFEANVRNWCRSMANEIEAAYRRGHCAGSFAWTWVWLDFLTDPGNSMVTYIDADWTAFTVGDNIPARNLWGALVYAMYLERDEDPYRGFYETATAVVTATLLRVAVRARAAATHAAPATTTRLRAAVRGRASSTTARTATTRQRVAVRARASDVAARIVSVRGRVVVRARTSDVPAHVASTAARVVVRGRAAETSARTSATNLRTVIRGRAADTRAATVTTRLRVVARSRATVLVDRPSATRLRAVVRARASDVAARAPSVRLRTVIRGRAAATTAHAPATALRVVVRARAAATSARAVATRERVVIRGNAATSTARQGTTRLRAVVRARAGALHAATVTTRLRAVLRARAGAVHAATTVARLRAVVRARAAATSARTVASKVAVVVRAQVAASAAGVVNTATRLRVVVRARAADTTARTVATRERVVVRSRASTAKGAVSAARLRVSVRARATAVKAAATSVRLRALVRQRVSVTTARQATPRVRVVIRGRAVVDRARDTATRLRIAVRARVAALRPSTGTVPCSTLELAPATASTLTVAVATASTLEAGPATGSTLTVEVCTTCT